jgi:3-isopropylmalate/(R)-2-methylmalate dehydratase small subunit
MHPLVHLRGVAAALLRVNIDTDTIAPGTRPATSGQPRQFSERGTDLARNLFAGWRYDVYDNELPEFVLNQPPYREARFLLAGANFGCGSSRESACWMLSEFGIRCIIAPSFGEIFFNNCFQNGMLPLVLDWSTVQRLAEQTTKGEFELDVEQSLLRTPAGESIRYMLPEFRRSGLLKGWDEVDLTLSRSEEIERFQQHDRETRPWIYRTTHA